MTDQELKDLVANTAIAQAKTDKQMHKTGEQIQELREAQLKTDEQIQELKEAQLRTEEQMSRTDKRLDKVAKMLGSIGNNQGSVAEEYFVNSLKDTLTLAGMDFDLLLRGVELNKKSVRDEFDILLVNGNSVAIIEVKYKVHPRDIEKLPQKIKRIKLMPQYRDYKVYAGLAGFHIPSEVIESLQEQGYFALQRKGDVIESYTDHLRAS